MSSVKKCIYILLIFFILSQFSLVFAEQVVNDVPKYKVSGYIQPDFDINQTNSASVKANFKVEIVELQLSTVTDSNGYYEIDCVQESSSGYTVKISKPTFLLRSISNVAVTSNIQIGTQTNPILMWAGDVPVSGVQDNVINTIDQIEISRGFNTSAGSPDYTLDRDLNKDGSIDMIDISILSRHFNATPESYIPVVSNIMPTGKIKMQVDKTIVNVGDIVTATVSIQDISNLIGYQINIKYDPAVLQPVIDGIPYTNSTFPTKGTILANQTYSPFDLVDNKLINGVLNFSSAYLCMAKYRQNAQPETSGTLAVINFKVLNNTPTYIKFQGYKSMPRAILGTYLYEWNGATYNSGYSVIQPQRIN